MYKVVNNCFFIFHKRKGKVSFLLIIPVYLRKKIFFFKREHLINKQNKEILKHLGKKLK